MLYLITGENNSGKSEYAENLAISLQRGCLKKTGRKPSLIYLATMFPYSEENFKRIKRHRKMRSGKGFTTVERTSHIAGLSLRKFGTEDSRPILLLDCLPDLAWNEMNLEEGAKVCCVEEILRGITVCAGKSQHLVIVTNEAFSDGINYSRETTQYMKNITELNVRIAAMADEVTEIYYSIPISIKRRINPVLFII